MKKFIYLLTILIVVMFSICACDNNQEQLNNNSENQNSQVTNQNENTNNTSSTIKLNSGENIKETLSEEQKESGEKTTEEVEKNEEKIETSQSQSISASTTTLSNQTNAWGFVRQKNEVRPQFSASYTKVLDDYEGIYAGNSEEKVIYLTFDEGYENGYTGAILDTLKEKDCPATFFVTKPYVKQNQELVQRMIDEGHIVR